MALFISANGRLVTLTSLVAFIAFASSPTRADLPGAYAAYKKGDFSTAFKNFREFAELGQPLAQRNVAVMYLNGEGTEKSLAHAYAWASLAVENGAEDANTIVAKTKPLLSPDSMKIAAEVLSEFSREALDKRLMPQYGAEKKPDRGTCKLSKAYISNYPLHARRRGIQGSVVVEFSVMPDGRARIPRIVYAMPQGTFDNTVREGVRRSSFIPGRFNGELGPCLLTIFYKFELAKTTASDYPRLDKFVNETRIKAEAGDMRSQMLYGMLLAGLPQLQKPRSEALPWFLKAAQAGAPLAQYQVGYSILKGWGCQCEEPKGLVWLRKAAATGQSDAQVTLAQVALSDSSAPENVARAKAWLERAVAQDHRDAKLYLAALLAAIPLAEIRDPARSLSLLSQIFKDVDDDPTAFEIRAAAQAAAGEYASALKDQKKAVTLAKQLGWDLKPHNERLARYEAREPWYGNLLSF